MVEHTQGQAGADRSVGRPGPAAKMTGSEPDRPRPSVLIPPVTSTASGSAAASAAAATAATAAPTRSAPAAPASPGGTPAAPAKAPPAATPAAPAKAPPAPAPAAAPGPNGQQQGPQQPAAGRPAAPQQSGAATVARSAVRPPSGPRAARVYITHIDPWAVMKQAFLLSLALAVIILAASAALWFALESAGVIAAITRTATDVGGESGASVSSYLDLGKVMGAALVVAGIQTVLVTALCTLMAFMYNLSVGIGGGLEVTLSEED